MLKLHDGIASESVNIKKSFEEEAAKYNANVADDMKVQEGEEKREQFHSRDVTATDGNRSCCPLPTLNTACVQARLAHIAAYKGSVAAHEKIRVNRIDKEEAKGNTEVNEHIQRLMEMIRKNVTVIQKTNADLEKRVHTVNNEEKESFAKALKDVQQQLSDVSKHRQDVIDMSAEIEQVGEGITTMQDDLKKVTQGTTAVQSRASALEDSITTEHDKIKQALSDTEEHIERVRGNLAHLVSLTAQVGDSLKSETDAHERMAKREEDEMGKMKGAVKDMEPQLQTILSLSGDVTELQGQVKTKLQAFEDKVPRPVLPSEHVLLARVLSACVVVGGVCRGRRWTLTTRPWRCGAVQSDQGEAGRAQLDLGDCLRRHQDCHGEGAARCPRA
eukprot:445018-Rhodomonas_salina.1